MSCDANTEVDVTSSQENIFQAMFACLVCVPTYDEWVNMKWGFNASALIEEALSRQKLFIESQHTIDLETQMERQDRRTLALRIITLPGKGLQLGLLGKIQAPSSEQATKDALIYWRELESIFPYDYKLVAAVSQDDFRRAAGWDLLIAQEKNSCVVQIKRGNAFLPEIQGWQCVSGLWCSSPFSFEQIWRAMAAMPIPTLLNIALRPTLLYEYEQQILWEIKKQVANPDKNQIRFDYYAPYLPWVESYLKRRLAPWKKFFYLQVHLFLDGEFDESILRCIASCITSNASDQVLPGYQLLRSPSENVEQVWRKCIYQMEIIPSSNRMEEIGDLEETLSVFRLPYNPPPPGLPNVRFLTF
jgi:hypothetical protein